MKNIFITGATGNVGTAALAALANLNHDFNVIVGVKDPANDQTKLAKFTLIDVRDIGQVAAVVLTNTQQHLCKAYELTCSEKLNFQEMANELSTGLGLKIKYESPNLWRFFWQKRRENVPAGYILVLIMLHYFPRFQTEPNTTDCVETLTGQKPRSFEQFVADYKTQLQLQTRGLSRPLTWA